MTCFFSTSAESSTTIPPRNPLTISWLPGRNALRPGVNLVEDSFTNSPFERGFISLLTVCAVITDAFT
jgi:hypothetical protein